MVISVIQDKVYISSNIKKVLHKKVNVFYQNKSEGVQKVKFAMTSHNELIQIKVGFFKKMKIILIALSLLLLYFTKIFRITPRRKLTKKNNKIQ